jgi:hypothetical protein
MKPAHRGLKIYAGRGRRAAEDPSRAYPGQAAAPDRDPAIARLAALRAAELQRIVKPCSATRIWPVAWSSCSACRGLASGPPSRSCCVCPNSAISAARRRRSPAWRRSTTTAAGTRDSATSPAGGRGCAAALRRRIARGMPLEPGADGTRRAPHPGWKTSQARARRLRPKAPHLRQHACHPRHSMDRKASPKIMVATLAASVIPRA